MYLVLLLHPPLQKFWCARVEQVLSFLLINLFHVPEMCLSLQSDVIVGLGSHDPRVAIETAWLWLGGWAKVIVFTGHSGNLTAGKCKSYNASICHNPRFC